MLQTERLQRDFVRSIGTFFGTVHDTETLPVAASAVVPHIPTDAVMLESGANIVNPSRPVLRVRVLAIYAEFIAGERNVPVLRPLGSLSDFNRDPVRVPVIECISQNSHPIQAIGLLQSNLL